ncbi:Protease KEX1 [Smittium culicis]|uniref:Protease KEX1 n=1 Tax=Smittium culicis TaxID=133412 RepID=A0A1R1X3V0_9FUNG|nr:Protease KEX1 [Smittium culicis]
MKLNNNKFLSYLLALLPLLQTAQVAASSNERDELVKRWLKMESDSGPEFPENFQKPGYNYFHAKFSSTDEKVARDFAKKNDLEYIGRLGMLPDRHVFKKDSSASNSTTVKRADFLNADKLIEFEAAKTSHVLKRRSIADLNPRDWKDTIKISDPMFDKQWHLINNFSKGNDINVTSVWEMGVTGLGVTVALIDDGLDYTSEDLFKNFNIEGSYDFNDNTKLPTPRLGDDYHGTRCAGQIAAIRNKVCGVGVAYNSKVSGIRMLSGPVSELAEISALNYKYNVNDIYSCSWGPTDDGATVQAPTKPMLEAIQNGISNGRKGLGNIFVFATGNGGRSDDNCNFDGYTNSIYTVSIGAIDYKNTHPDYSESCSAQLAVTYSSGGGKRIVTSDLGLSGCTESHGGTSAAAPLAAGIFALVLSVRPDLSWRDVQQLIVDTAVPVSELDNDWDTVANGRKFNHKFGFGKLDSYQIVNKALYFDNLANQTVIEIPVVESNLVIPDLKDDKSKKGVTSSVKVDSSAIKKANFKKLEHITVKVKIDHTYRGNIYVKLTSPEGIVSELATPRHLDRDMKGLDGWTFMSVKHWGGKVEGEWKLNVGNSVEENHTGTLVNWEIKFFGESNTTPPTKKAPILNQKPENENSSSDESIPPFSDTKPSTPQSSKPSDSKAPQDNNEVESAKPTPDAEGKQSEFDASKIYVGLSQPEFISLVVLILALVGAIIYLVTRLSRSRKYGGSSWSALSSTEANNINGLLFQEDEFDPDDDGLGIGHQNDEAFRFFEMPSASSRRNSDGINRYSDSTSAYDNDTNDETHIGSVEYSK